MKPKNLARLVGILIILMLIGIASGVVINSGKVIAGRNEPWPAFTLVYNMVWHPHDPEQPAASETWKVDYTDTNHWRTELIASTASSTPAGFWTSFDGEVYRTYHPNMNYVEETKVEKWTVPNEWLVPGLMDSMEYKGYHLAEGAVDSDSVTYTKTEPFECKEGPPTCPRTDEPAYTWTTEITFSKEYLEFRLTG